MDPQIVADESVDFRIVVQLREKGIQVYSVIEELQSAKDEMVLKVAINTKLCCLPRIKTLANWFFAYKCLTPGFS